MFIKRQLVSVPSLGLHQGIMTQESEYIQKLKLFSGRFSLSHQDILQAYAKNAK